MLSRMILISDILYFLFFLELAIVAAYHGDEFSATYRYFRSLAVESPFVTARDNLIIAFERVSNFTRLIVMSCNLKLPI